MRYKNPTPNPLPASDEGAKMYLTRAETAVLHNCLSENPDFANRLIRIKKNNQPKSGIQVFIYQEY
jgi:hypothetical protein